MTSDELKLLELALGYSRDQTSEGHKSRNAFWQLRDRLAREAFTRANPEFMERLEAAHRLCRRANADYGALLDSYQKAMGYDEREKLDVALNTAWSEKATE